jgi:hypothetical protein
MGKSAPGPPFLKEAFLAAKLFIPAKGIRVGGNTGPDGLFIFPAQLIIHQSLYVKISYRLGHCFFF